MKWFQEQLSKLGNSIPFIIIATLLLGSYLISKFDFSITDYIADRVIEKMELKYSPYGPNVVDPRQQPENKVQDDPWTN